MCVCAGFSWVDDGVIGALFSKFALFCIFESTNSWVMGDFPGFSLVYVACLVGYNSILEEATLGSSQEEIAGTSFLLWPLKSSSLLVNGFPFYHLVMTNIAMEAMAHRNR